MMKFARIKIGVAALVFVATTGVSQVSAAKPKVPGKPVIVSVQATRIDARYSKLTFIIEVPSANGSPIISTTISTSSGPKCTIKRNARTCSISRVRSNAWYQWTAQSRNKVGVSARSSRVNLLSRPGRWLRSGYTPEGTKYPAPASRTTSTRVLQDAKTNSLVQRWSKFQAIRQSGVTAASVRAAAAPSTNPPTVTFLTSGVVGLALPSSGAAGSGLLAVNRDGSTVDAVLSSTGNTSIRDFYAAPNNKFYVVFTSPRPLYNGGPNCILAEVDADSGNPVCVDSQITSVSTTYGVFGPFGGTATNNPIQFDRSGNIYYVGTVPYTGSVPGPAMTTLRRSANGTLTSLVTENSQIRDFLVLEDGNVLVSGMTTSTQTSWVRRISPSGALTNISSNSQSSFLRRFADGNVYMSFQGMQTSVRRYLTASGAMDPLAWISPNYGNDTDTHFSTQTLCNSQSSSKLYLGFCSMGGATIATSFNLGTTATFVVAGQRSIGGTNLFQYWPTVAPVSVSVRNITLATMVGSKLILAGTTAEGVNTMSVLDLTSFQETVLIDASNEIEIYNLSYIAATNKIMFNGLRFADNTFVVGEVDMP